MTHTALVCDLAVAAADVLSGREDGLELAHEVVAGYAAVTPLEPEEVALVADLMAGALRRHRPDHRLAHPRAGLGAGDRRRGLRPARGDARRRAGHADSAVHRRRRAAPRARRTAARAALPPPVHDRAAPRALAGAGRAGAELRPAAAPRGWEGCSWRRADGRRYLDAYNNVPVLGHSHPAVVDAVCSQLATLNTNSRYLQEAPVELAERLLATLPARFDRVLLVNSGSEANDLAWRIARHATGASGGIATSWAYHGVTEATFAFSPESWGDAPAPAPRAAGRAAAGDADRGGVGGREPRRVGPRRGGHVRRRRVHQRRHPRAGSRLDRGGRRRGARGGRPVRRRRGAGRATAAPGRTCGASSPGACPPTW